MPSNRYLELSNRHLGGMNPKAFDSFFYWNNPFTLKHWTMNVVELLLIGGAVMALVHAWQVLTAFNDPKYLCIWFAALIYILAIEIPIYFPEKFGLDPEQVIFIHNEFTAGILFNQAPVYILALYPALLCLSYVFVDQAGLFDGSWGLLLGTVCAAFVHHVFYQIFDHLGPQFGWWLWDYEKSKGGKIKLGSVPFYTLFNFSFVCPLAFMSLTQGVIGLYVESYSGASGFEGNLWILIGLTIAVGLMTTPLSGVFGKLFMKIASFRGRTDQKIKFVNYAVLAVSAVVTATAFGMPIEEYKFSFHDNFIQNYAVIFGTGYLVVFAFLWGAGLKDYFNSVEGLTPQGKPIGSLAYAIGCFIACCFVILASTL